MFPTHTFVSVIHADRVREAEKARVARAYKLDQPAPIAQPKRRRGILGLAARVAPAR
jgi:hypothetical protein